MPTRKNKTSIGVADSIKHELSYYIDPVRHQSWDDFMKDVLLLIRADAEGRIIIK